MMMALPRSVSRAGFAAVLRLSLRLALALTAVVLVSGCSADQDLRLESDGSGTVDAEISVHPMLRQYMADLTASVGQQGEFRLFQPEALSQSFAARSGVDLVSVSEENPGGVRLRAAFAGLEAVLASEAEEVQETVSFTRGDDGTTRLRIELDRRAVRAVLSLSPLSGSEAFSMVLPPAEDPMSPEEYVEYLAWAFEEYEQDRPVEEVIRGAEIEVRLHVPGSVVSQEGGTIRDEDTVAFSIDVVRLLTLPDPVVYQVVFR
jgi:hypothetical protein